MIIVGVDEVGRGPLAGPVVAAAVILDKPIDGVKDSKLLSPKKREKLSEIIKIEAVDYALGQVDEKEIDKLNILNASLLAMSRAINNLKVQPTLALVDGTFIPPNIDIQARAIKGGDRTELAISAASIIAKVFRDNYMLKMHDEYPQYDFISNKGYPTKKHIAALNEHGVCQIHRMSFAPVKRILEQ